MQEFSFFDKYIDTVKRTEPIKYIGKVTSVAGLLIESQGPHSVIGEICTIQLSNRNKLVMAEVIGLKDKTVRLMAYESTEGIEVGDVVVASGHLLEVPVGEKLLGRVLDATGRPCDGKGEVVPEKFYPAVAPAPDAMKRTMITKRVVTGVRAIDSLLSIGEGQRVGLFAGSGIGKSTLISMIARNTTADVNVIGQIGERGREALEFIKKDLGEEGLNRSVVVLATGDQTPIAKIRAAYVTTAIAEYFRDQGKSVMLMMDSVTRFAQAQRDIGTANGEAPQRRGYPSSAFTMIQQLMERTGRNDKGSITAFYTVLVDGGDLDEPVSDTARGILDGHIVLDRELQSKQHYPAIDILASISRLSRKVNGEYTNKAIQRVKKWIADYASQEDMITNGIYERGSSVEIDEAIEHHQAIEDFVCQAEFEKADFADTLKKLSELSGIEIPEEEYNFEIS